MPKRKLKVVETDLINLVEELNEAQEVIVNRVELEKDAPASDEKKVEVKAPKSTEISKKREELIKLAEDREIPQTVAGVKRASAKVIDRIFFEWEGKCKDRAATFLCDQFLSKFCAVLGGFDAVEKPEELEKELKRDPLLKKDVESIMSMFTHWIPFLGVLSGGLTVRKHVLSHKGGQVADGFARGPFGGEKPPEERTEAEVKNGYDTEY